MNSRQELKGQETWKMRRGLGFLRSMLSDKGVVTGDIGYIWLTGALKLAVTLVQVVCAIYALYFVSKLAMEIGRDLRYALFRPVVSFSQREVGQFGAASLITRNISEVAVSGSYQA